MAAFEAREAIFRAGRAGDIEGVVGKLDKDPRLLLSTCKGCTLLGAAALEGHIGVVRLLLERGGDVNIADAWGNTALHCAALHPQEELVSMLLTSGADPSRINEAGRTALINASLQGHEAVVRLLLRAMGGRGLDQRNQHGCTALFFACMEGRANILRILLLAGADHTIAGNSGTTPQQVAQDRRHPQCITLIQWWEDELQRPYVLHKARALHEDTTTRQQAPAARVPAYLGPRVQGGKRLPRVQVRGRGGSGGPRTRGAAKRGREHEEGQEKQEELYAMVGYVVGHLPAELYIELLAGLQ